ncbi:hypothetical protein B0T10DRAFT_117016 [Thelonectria olida]|uniref:Uncharacterized protein n=1 Tax=Thelonectria olida TaxID=1576542 RepID=A0A9P9AYF1_9HYPO|nr:hypothetical protein B0T10DRAFT_117016 [Thelonectria olida]
MPHARWFRSFLIDPTNRATGKLLPSVVLTSLLYSYSSAALRRQGDEGAEEGERQEQQTRTGTRTCWRWSAADGLVHHGPLRRSFVRGGPLLSIAPFRHPVPQTATFAYACATHITNFYWAFSSHLLTKYSACRDYLRRCRSASSASAAHCAASASPFRYYHAS